MLALSALNLRTWAMIGAGAVIALLLIALLATRGTLSEVKHERDAAVMKLSVSNSSIETLARETDRMKRETMALADSDALRRTASRQAVLMAEAAAKVRQAAISRLEQSAARMMGEPVVEQCKASETLLGEWAA